MGRVKELLYGPHQQDGGYMTDAEIHWLEQEFYYYEEKQ